MEDKERQEWLDSLWPLDKPRWFKVRIHDQEKAVQNLPWIDKHKDRLGFVVEAITCRDEFRPQVTALADLKDEVYDAIAGRAFSNAELSDTFVELAKTVRELFNAKMKEIDERTIKTIPINTNEESKSN